MVDIQHLRTGKQQATSDSRDLLFSMYVDADKIDLSTSPPSRYPGHARFMPKPRLMLGNGPDDSVRPGFLGAGDCVFAMITNMKRIEFEIVGKGLFPATGLTAIENYAEVTGYDIDQTDDQGNNPTDKGTNMRTAMNWLRRTGYKDATGARHQIGAYAVIKVGDGGIDVNHLKWAMYLADGGIPLGVRIGDAQMQQFQDDKPWQPSGDEQDGHAILADHTFAVETWARDQRFLEPFLSLVDEAYFPVDPEGMVNGQSIEGFNAQQLLADASSF